MKANRLTDRHGVMLTLPDRDVWTFSAYEDTVEIEESVFLAGPDGPRRTVQIVIYGHARTRPRCSGRFAIPRARPRGRREAARRRAGIAALVLHNGLCARLAIAPPPSGDMLET